MTGGHAKRGFAAKSFGAEERVGDSRSGEEGITW